MPNYTCRICKRPLKEHTSVKLGMGPVCRTRDGLNMELDLFPHAKYTIHAVEESYIYIQDIGTCDRSVTNDAEWVLARLAEEYGLNNRRVFYMDSMGQIDEITHNGGGHFTGFKPGHKGVVL